MIAGGDLEDVFESLLARPPLLLLQVEVAQQHQASGCDSLMANAPCIERERDLLDQQQSCRVMASCRQSAARVAQRSANKRKRARRARERE